MNPPDQPTPTQPTATPRTDAHIRENGYEIAGVYVGANVHPDFARQLETELAAAKAEREMLAKCHTDNCASITQLAQELNAARASAMADFEYFHEIRVRITEICGDPYLLHPEALEAIAAELARLRAEVERLKITAETVSLSAGIAHPTLPARVGAAWILELLARAARAEAELAAIKRGHGELGKYEQLRLKNAELHNIIDRASTQFFHDGTDGEIAANMIAILNKAK